MHYIRYDVLYAYVLSRVQYWSKQVEQDGDALLQRLLDCGPKAHNRQGADHTKGQHNIGCHRKDNKCRDHGQSTRVTPKLEEYITPEKVFL